VLLQILLDPLDQYGMGVEKRPPGRELLFFDPSECNEIGADALN
jgi:hypothetical protein